MKTSARTAERRLQGESKLGNFIFIFSAGSLPARSTQSEHVFTTRLRKIRLVQKVLGHSDLSMMIYTHVFDPEVEEALT